MKVLHNNSDTIGVFTSLVCSIHCFATPILFVAQSGLLSSNIQPLWWESINYIFIALSFIAVYYSAKNTSENIMKPILWLCWLFFVSVILNEMIELTKIPELFSLCQILILKIIIFFLQLKILRKKIKIRNILFL